MVRLIKKIWQVLKIIVHWTMRLLNLLEPNVPFPVISISKLSMWATLFSTVYLVIYNPTSEALATSLGAQLAATANYGVRRWLQVKTKTGAYADPEPLPESDISEGPTP